MSNTKTDIPDFDDLDSVEVDSGGNGEWINLDAGDEVGGEITDVNLDAMEYGVVEIDGRPFSLNKTIRDQMVSALVEGGIMVVRKSEDEESFEDDDTGETVTYNPKEARFGRAGGD